MDSQDSQDSLDSPDPYVTPITRAGDRRHISVKLQCLKLALHSARQQMFELPDKKDRIAIDVSLIYRQV